MAIFIVEQDWRRNSPLLRAGLASALRFRLKETGPSLREAAPKPWEADMEGEG
jgi:hypothetical protein